MKKFLKNYDFEDYFEPHILVRGKNYYLDNRILDIWYRDNSVFAYIGGTEIYKIVINIYEKVILYCYCSCPYFCSSEFMCKHIAAVLYYLQDNEVPKLEKKNKSKKVKILYLYME